MKLGAYQVTGELGRGGMGIVYRGRGPDGADVAIKVLRRTGAVDLDRFARERRLLAQVSALEGFVPLLDQGDAPEGPFLVMPFLPGGTLGARLRDGPLSIDATVRLGRAIARALARAHARGLVHRDLKPDNVLFDAQGVPHLADLGLAKHFRRDVPGASRSLSLSGGGEFRGTAGYMPPEQMLDAKVVGPSADVFAAGVILYECLSGRSAFQGETLHELVAAVAEGDVPPLLGLRGDAPRALVKVVERAMATRPEDRPADGAALLRALDAALAPPRGNGRRVLLGAAALATLVVVGLVATRVRQPAGELGGGAPAGPPAELAAAGSGSASEPPRTAATDAEAPALEAMPEVDPGAVPGLSALLERPRLRLAAVLGQYAWRHPDAVQAVALSPDGRLVWAGGQDPLLRGWDLATGSEALALPAKAEVRALAAAGALVVSGEGDGVVRVWDAAAGRLVWDPATELGSPSALVAHPDGRRVVVGCERGVLVLDVEASRVVHSLPLDAPALGVAVSRDGARLAVALGERGVALFELTLGERLPAPLARDARAVAFSPAGRLVVGGGDGRVAVAPDGPTVRALEGPISALAMTAEDRAVVGGEDGRVVLVALAAAKATPIGRHGAAVTSLAVTADGARAVTASVDDTVGVWDLATGRRAPLGPGHSGWARSLAVTADGARLLSVGGDGQALAWDLETGRSLGPLVRRGPGGEPSPVSAAVVLPGAAREAVLAHLDGTLSRWDLTRPGPSREGDRLDAGAVVTNALAAPPDGRCVFAGGADGSLSLVDLVAPGARGVAAPTGDAIHALAVLGAGLFAGDAAGVVRVSGGPSHGARWSQGAPVMALTAGPDRLFVGLRDGRVRGLDPATGVALTDFSAHAHWVLGLAASPRGEHLLSAGRDGVVALHDAGTGELLDRLPLGDDLPTAVAWLPDGRAFLVGTARGVVLRFALTASPRIVATGVPPGPERSAFHGLVRGPGGGPLEGVVVLLWRHGDGFTTAAMTGADGAYAASVPHGVYNIAVNKATVPGHRRDLPSRGEDNVAVPERQGADFHLSDGPYGARILGTACPPRVGAGERFEATLELMNTGDETWRQTRVALSNERFAEPGRGGTSPFHDPDWLGADRVAGFGDVPPGERARVRLPLRAPATPGRHTLHLELVEELVAWFDGSGDDVTLEVEVLPPR